MWNINYIFCKTHMFLVSIIGSNWNISIFSISSTWQSFKNVSYINLTFEDILKGFILLLSPIIILSFSDMHLLINLLSAYRLSLQTLQVSPSFWKISLTKELIEVRAQRWSWKWTVGSLDLWAHFFGQRMGTCNISGERR